MANLFEIKFNNQQTAEWFRQNGYVRLDSINEIASRSITNLYNEFNLQWSRSGFYSTMMINDTNYRSKVSSSISKLIEPILLSYLSDFEILFSNFLVKLPRTDNYVGMHQDWDFVDERTTESINFWVPLQQVDDSNGNFFMVKKSHLHFKQLRGTPYLNFFRNYETALESKSTPLYPKQGELILYHGRTLHYSKPNVSTKTRLAVGGVVIPKGASVYHYRNDGNELNPEWKRYTVDQKFFETFTPEQVLINDYPAETVAEHNNLYHDSIRKVTIENFLSELDAS